MEKKQLDFNAPLLSVRRFSSTLAHSNRDTREINGNALPNRRHTMVSVRSDYNLEQVTEPVAVPFLWEHTPGRAKSRSGPLPQSKPLDGFFDNEMEDQNVFRTKAQLSNSNSNLMKLEPSDWENGGDNDEAYSDALDRLSPASFSLHCSVSGLSGSDGLDTKPSGTFSTDAQTRDFMLSRFLPAAKAMTLETPHYVSRKQSLTPSHEQPREVKKIITDDKKLFGREYATRIIPYVEQGKREEESESEEDDHSVAVLAKSRGFLPRLRSSLCLLNPVPGMKLRSQSPKASTGEVRKQKKSYSGPLSHIIDKHTLEANYNDKIDFGMKNKQTRNPIRQSYSGELPTTNRSSPYRNSRIGVESPHRNEKSASPLHQAVKFIGIPKIVKSFKADRSNKEYDEGHQKEGGQGSISPVAEKTLYIDSINTVQYTNFHSNSSQNKAKIKPGSREGNVLKRSSIVKAKVPGYSNGNSPSYSDISHLKGLAESRRTCDVSLSHSNLNPPLPKCPSESWLWRTLPSVRSRSSSPHSRKVAQTTSSPSTKWENIVKTSYLHHDRMRYSEELIANGRKKTRT